jgi:ATP-dependent Clp protease adaptor protein ClpS
MVIPYMGQFFTIVAGVSFVQRRGFHAEPVPYILRLAHQGGMMQAQVHMMADKEGGSDSDVGVALETKPKTKRPPMYKVMILNDDFTPMEFVVHVLERFFGLSHAQAFELMLTVHKKGLAVVGVFSHEIAETKVAQVMDFAQRHQHPLQCTMEKE